MVNVIQNGYEKQENYEFNQFCIKQINKFKQKLPKYEHCAQKFVWTLHI